MENSNVVKSRVLDHFTLELFDTKHAVGCTGVDAEGNDCKCPVAVRKLRLCYTYRAIAKIEKKIGKDIKNPKEWATLSSGNDFPVIVWGGLDKFNPEVTLDEVMDFLNPDAQELLSVEIAKMLFPGFREAVEKAERGEPEVPNAETVTTSA